jgi:hypothetical protein
MGWLTLGELDGRVFYDVIDEIKTGSPRATAIVAGAFVEDHLTRVIRWRLVQKPVSKDKNPADDMFRPGGPVGDFSNKIDLAYVLACITKEAWKELDTIRRIRNAFAHKMEISDFDAAGIADRCANLKLWEEIKIKLRPADNTKSGKIILTIGRSVEEGEQLLPTFDMLSMEDIKTPRDRYVAACQFYIAAFSIIIHEAKALPKPLI